MLLGKIRVKGTNNFWKQQRFSPFFYLLKSCKRPTTCFQPSNCLRTKKLRRSILLSEGHL